VVDVALPARFSLLHSEFNAFLFAPVEERDSGAMPLSVLSALTRLGVDPWAEAARLARLPPPAAAESLAPLIARLPEFRTEPSDARTAAERFGQAVAERPSRDARRHPCLQAGERVRPLAIEAERVE
jgi:hypothetical protein